MSSDQESNIEARLCAYIDGLLDAEQRESIEQYLDRYPEHRQLIDQLMQERALLRDLPKESAPADVLAHFQGQLERAVLLDDLDTVSGKNGRVGRRGRWNLAALLAFLLLAFGVSVIVWIAMPPKRVHESAATVMAPEIATTLPVDTTQTSATVPTSEPIVPVMEAVEGPVLAQPRATLLEVSGSNLLIVMISSPDLPAAEARVEAFLKLRSLTHPGEIMDKDLPSTMPATSPTHLAWEVPGMTRDQAKELVSTLAMIPATAPAATESVATSSTMQGVATTHISASTRPTTVPAIQVMIIFQNTDFPLPGPEKSGS